jgi:hypothetical protein
VKYVLATAVLLLAGCSSAPEVAVGGPASSATSAQLPEPTTTHVVQDGAGRPARVGVLIGSRLRDVRLGLRDLGLQVDVRHRARCLPGVVLAQRPAPGARLERGGTVHLVVARAPAAATCIHPPGIAVSRALRAWALGDAPPPAFADRVRLLVANRPVRTLSDLEAADPERWTLPVPYAERIDVRILETLAAAPTRGTRVPPYFCLGRGPVLPADLVRRLPWSWTLVTRDAEATACMDVAAVQVWADGDGRITDVNLLMGSP